MKDETFKKVVDVLIADGCTPLDCIDLVQRMATYIKNFPSDKPRTTTQDVQECIAQWDTNLPTGYADRVAFTLVATATPYYLTKNGLLARRGLKQTTTSTTFAHVVTASPYLYDRNITTRPAITKLKKLAVWAPFANTTPKHTQAAPVFREDV